MQCDTLVIKSKYTQMLQEPAGERFARNAITDGGQDHLYGERIYHYLELLAIFLGLGSLAPN